MVRRRLTLALIVLPASLFSERPPIQPYTTSEGLADDRINNVVTDSRGLVWFCTPQGLSRFDGYRIVNFSVADGLPHRDVTTLIETRLGAYLVGTDRGLCEFRERGDGKFTTYLPGSKPAENGITALLEDSAGRIWCGTFAGLFEMTGDHKFHRRPLTAPGPGRDSVLINDMLEDSGHRLWVATRGGIDVIGRDGGIQHIALGPGTENVRALQMDRFGRIWAGTQDGLALLRAENSAGTAGVERLYREAVGVKQLDITSLAASPDGALWAGASVGILRWFPSDRPGPFRLLTRAQGLTDRQVNALAMDRAGNMWAGTEGAGVMKIQAAGLTTFSEQDGLGSDRVGSVLVDQAGTVLAITHTPRRHWVSVFDGAMFHPLAVPGFSEHPPWGNHRILLQAKNGAWWAATAGGLCMYRPAQAAALGESRPQTCYAPDTLVYQIFEDSKGRVWASTEPLHTNRLMRWDPGRSTISWIDDGPSRKELVGAFIEDQDGNVWMGLLRGGLLRYDGRGFTRFQQSAGVPPGSISDLYLDHAGRLWVASSGGLGVVDEPGSPNFKMRVYGARDGLASSEVAAVVEDRAGRIYACTPKGVDRLDPQTGRVKHISAADGLAHGLIRGAVRDSSGDLWFATTQGISRLSPGADKPPAIPTVLITDLYIGRQRYSISQAGETRISRGDLQPSENQLRVAFVGFSDEPEAHLRYTYKLEGGAGGWQGPGREHEVNYAELAPGSYRFLVKATNSDGRESAAPAEIDFVILPPLWRRWWFQSLALAGAAGLALAAHQRRLQWMTARVRLLYEERLDERTRIARELHDTLLQSLAGVSLQLDGVAKQIRASSEPAASQIRAVRQQVDASFLEARRKVQDLRSPTLQGRTLPAVLRESLEQIVAGHPVRLRMAVTGQPRPLPEEIDEALLRIGQEAVANAVRHAQASEIQVSLCYEGRSLRLHVQDDGRGFDLDEASRRVGHWGLRNMQERAHRIGAQWKISAAAARGTEIEASVPLSAGNGEG